MLLPLLIRSFWRIDITGATAFLRLFLRIQGKTHADYDLLAEQNLSQLDPTLYRLPLENTTDLNINETDGNIDSNTPYTGMSVDYLTGATTATTRPSHAR